jgi:3-dehydroquinate synthase
MSKGIVHRVTQDIQVNFRYSVLFTESTFATDNTTLADLVCADLQGVRSPRVLVVIDDNVCKSHPTLITEMKSYALAHQIDLVRPPLIVPGGEQIKKEISHLKSIYQLVADEQIDRHSYILAIGGGAVLDAVGFAAATAHRGVRLVRMPTTVLAQNDAGVGVKTGVNYLDRKNYLGAFAPPYAVVNDFDLLATLKPRDKRSGMAEAVKVALIKDAAFFDEMCDCRDQLAGFERSAMQRMIIRCAELHLDHISTSGDPFEMGSARPLDFGHWSAHKLEALSGYSLRHGEAVAIGIALDTLYSYKQGMIEKEQCDVVLTLLADLGFELSCAALIQLDVKAALDEFREHLGGLLCITLLTGLGTAKEVNHIDVDQMQSCVSQLREFQGVRQPA